MLVSATEEKEDDIIGINALADGSCGDYITLKTHGKNCPLVDSSKDISNTFIQMKGKDVYKFVMTKIPPKIAELMKNTNYTSNDIDYFVPHQSNQRMIEALAQRLELDDSKVVSNIEHYGNMSAASILVAIREEINNGKIKLPAKVLISAFGAGMTGTNAIISLDKNV